MRRVLAIIGATGLATAALVAATSGGAGAQPVEQTIAYTGSAEDYIVPAGVCSITVTAIGAAGGNGDQANEDVERGLGAPGGSATATLPVTPGESLTVVVGGAGETPTESRSASDEERGAQVLAGTAGNRGGFNGGGDGGDDESGETNPGGGGGGATEIQRAGVALLIASGGGGGAGYNNAGNGGAGGESGDDGTDAFGSAAGGGASGGNGGAGGAGGSGGEAGAAGSAGQGGSGGDGLDSGGGGGGGATGGGGGGANDADEQSGGGGGGGGSSAGPAGTVFATGVDGDADGNGVLVISYDPAASSCPIVVEPRFTG
jgi:hypothetical protein